MIVISIPERMRHLPLDRRGYPIPVIVTTKGGQPQFSINDLDVTNRMIAEDRCTICGGKLFRGRWLVGGGLSALAHDGKFADAPTHQECVYYALKVCPYLAAPNWRVTVGKVKAVQADIFAIDFADDGVQIADVTRPEAFVAVMASKVDIERRGVAVHLCRPRPGHVLRAEVWRFGQIVTGADLAEFMERARRKVERVGSELRTDIWDLLARQAGKASFGLTRFGVESHGGEGQARRERHGLERRGEDGPAKARRGTIRTGMDR